MANPWESPYPSPVATTPKPWETPVPGSVQEPDPSEAQKLVNNAPGAKEAKGPMDAFYAGMHMSASGLVASGGKTPDMTVPANASFGMKLTNAVGQGLGDLPFSLLGAIGGGAATAETGPGAALGAGAGAGATPQAVRETMMDYYKLKEQGKTMTASDIVHMIATSAWETAKSAAEGAVGGKVAGVAGQYATSIGAPAVARTLSNVVAYSAGATAAHSVLNGKMPDAQDFAVSTIAALPVAGAGHFFESKGFVPNDAATRVQDNMKAGYASHGTPPWEQARQMKADPVINDEVINQDVNGNPVQPKMNAERDVEAEPYKASFKTNPHAIADEHEAEVRGMETEAHVQAHVEQLLPQIKTLEGSGDHAISPKGAVGRYQIMPGTARQYGFDPEKLSDPTYNEKVARTVLADLSRRFHGDTEAVLVAYNAGPGRAFQFIRDGRDSEELPLETQKYLIRAGFGGKGGEPPQPPPKGELPPPPEGDEPPSQAFLRAQARADFGDSLGEEQPRPNNRGTGVFRQMVSQLESARGIDRIAVKEGLLDPNKDLTAEDMYRQTLASDDRAAYFINKGPIDPITFEHKDEVGIPYGIGERDKVLPGQPKTTEGISLTDGVLKKIADVGGSKDEFDMYRIAKRTVDLAQKGVDVGVFGGKWALEKAQAVLSDPEMAKYEEINKAMQVWKRGGLEYARDSGLLTDDRIKAMEQTSSHVAIRRIMGDDRPFDVGAQGGKGFRATNPLKAMEGDDRRIIDPMMADIDNLRQIIKMSDRNRANANIVGMQEAFDKGKGGVDLGLTKIEDKRTKGMIAEPGSDVFKPYNMTKQEQEAMGPFAIEGRLGPDQFVIYRDGKPEVWRSANPELAQLMRGMDSSISDVTVKLWGDVSLSLTKALSLPAKLERGGIIGAFDFPLRVFQKHALSAWVQDPLHPPPLITAAHGMVEAFTKGSGYWELMRRGGLAGSLVSQDLPTNVMKAIDDQATLKQTGALDKTWNVLASPLHFAQYMNEALTTAERIGYLKRGKALGLDPNKVATMGRTAFLDFQDQAANGLARWAGQVIPFWKSFWLGTRVVRDGLERDPKGMLSRGVLGMVGLQVGLFALNKMADQYLDDKHKYSSMEQWEKDQYFVTPPIFGTRIKIGRPYIFGPLIGVPVERTLEAIWDHDPHAFDGWLKAAMSDATPSVIPTSVRPWLEQQTNHNFFTGLPLVSDSLKDATADQQYHENTSEVAKKVSAYLGGFRATKGHVGTDFADVSPIVLDNYVQEWGGSIGSLILHSLDAPLGKAPIESDWRDLPFVRGFVVQNPRMDTKQVSDFYRDAEQWSALHKDVSLEAKHGDMQAALADKSGLGQRAIILTRVEHALNVMHTALSAIQGRKDLSTDEKRQLSDRIYTDAWQVSRFGSKALRGQGTDEEAQGISDQMQGDIEKATGQNDEQ